MATMEKNTTIQNVLNELGIKEHNACYSTGLKWANTGSRETKKIYSPADGNLLPPLIWQQKKIMIR